jgi:hypothetical protein
MFTYELQRRLADAGAPTIALAVEPGVVPTNLDRHMTGAARGAVVALTRVLGQPDAASGALATLRAATDPAAEGGQYYRPDRFLGWSGKHPKVAPTSQRSRDTSVQRQLWKESESLTGVTYQFT